MSQRKLLVRVTKVAALRRAGSESGEGSTVQTPCPGSSGHMTSDDDVKSGDLSCTAQLVHTLGTRGVRWFHRPEKNLSHHIAPYP